MKQALRQHYLCFHRLHQPSPGFVQTNQSIKHEQDGCALGMLLQKAAYSHCCPMPPLRHCCIARHRTYKWYGATAMVRRLLQGCPMGVSPLFGMLDRLSVLCYFLGWVDTGGANTSSADTKLALCAVKTIFSNHRAVAAQRSVRHRI